MAERLDGGFGDDLGAERTFLAWIRTGLALMGFACAVDGFALYLQARVGALPIVQVMPYEPSIWFGTARIAPGVIVNVA